MHRYAELPILTVHSLTFELHLFTTALTIFLSAAYGHLLFFFVHAVFWLYVTRANHAAFSLLLFYNIFINSVIYASWQSTLCDKFATVV